MNQALALEIMSEGHNVLLTGPAGSGKTYVLNEFIRRAKREGKAVSVTATTGLAATHLGGNTIHSWSGIGIHDELPRDFHDYLLKGRRDIIEKTDVLVIDEISMLHDYRLDMIDEVARRVRGEDAPFGGIQVILCGDFFQLPPVNRSDSRQGGFVVHSQVWEEFDPVICYLEEQHRQDDDTFLEILNALRTQDVRRRHVEALLERQHAELDDNEVITELHTTNVNVDAINAAKLSELAEDERVYQMMTTGKINYVETLQRSCLALPELTLKKGAFVMCIKNNPEKRYVNGSLGVVKDFDEDTNYPIVELKNGKTITISPETWELRDGDKKRASVSQIPLRLAWAITVHKSQGMTLDAARMDLRRAFVEGMGYVALSRVRRLDALSLAGINKMALSVSADALAIDETLRSKSASDRKRLQHLEERAKHRKPEKEKKKSDSSWAAKVEKMRETYPNAFRPWKAEHDTQLQAAFKKGKTVKQISTMIGRQPGGVEARIKKYFGEDALIK